MDQGALLPTKVLKEQIYLELSNYIDPYLNSDLNSANCIKKLTIGSNNIILDLEFGYLFNQHFIELEQLLTKNLTKVIEKFEANIGIKFSLEININSSIKVHYYKNKLTQINHIKNIIAVGSGKGGVGKSTVAVNFAIALQQQGARVGILDADLYGPSIPVMLGTPNQAIVSNNKLTPHYSYGIYSISIGNLLEGNQPLIWRGPMVSSGLLELLHNTIWPELDYLVIDLPPGTGDLQLTLSQKIPLTACIIVTTPQEVSVLDAEKSLLMFQKLDLPILGVVENMSMFICTKCNHKYSIFGNGGGLQLANKYGLRLLGNIPLDLSVREQADLGLPIVHSSPNSAISQAYQNLANSAAAQLSKLPLALNLTDLSLVID